MTDIRAMGPGDDAKVVAAGPLFDGPAKPDATARFLAEPGHHLLLAYDDHPVSACVDQGSHWREDYFDESPIVEVGWRHFDLPGEPAKEEKYERFWRLGQIVTAVASAGLTIRSLEEFSTIYETYWREKDPRVPGQFVLLAVKPG